MGGENERDNSGNNLLKSIIVEPINSLVYWSGT